MSNEESVTMARVSAPCRRAPARQAWAARLGAAYARRCFSRRLDGLFVAGLEEARSLCTSGPVLLAATHVSYWDPLALLVLDEALGTDGRALMEARSLERLPFFGALGALPLRRGEPGGLRQDLKTAAGFLDRPGRALWVFPQGRQRPEGLRPLGLEPGVRLLARLSGAPVLPVAFRYGFREAEQPTAVVAFGPPLPAEDPDLVAQLDASLVEGLGLCERLLDTSGLRGEALPEGSPFQVLVAPARGSPDADLPTRTLSGLTRLLQRLGGRPG